MVFTSSSILCWLSFSAASLLLLAPVCNCKVFSRWIFIWLSCLGASLLVDITVIVNVCGLLGVILVMVIPGFLQLKSKQLCEEEFGRSETPFSWHFSNNCYVYIILVIAVVGSVYALVNLLM